MAIGLSLQPVHIFFRAQPDKNREGTALLQLEFLFTEVSHLHSVEIRGQYETPEGFIQAVLFWLQMQLG